MRLSKFNLFHTSKTMADQIPFDPAMQEAIIHRSICTGERVAGFKNKEDGHFTEVCVIHTDRELEDFKKTYGLSQIKTEY